MTKVDIIRKFASAVLGERVIIVRKRGDWGMSLIENHPRLELPADIYQNDKQDKLFRKDFIRRYNGARGFSNVTISVLHELGHWVTRAEVDWEEYYILQDQVSGQEYFDLYGERVATDWAIQWLSIPENRRKAKAFEAELRGIK